jgi:beta-N-acetylhexosaminidase
VIQRHRRREVARGTTRWRARLRRLLHAAVALPAWGTVALVLCSCGQSSGQVTHWVTLTVPAATSRPARSSIRSPAPGRAAGTHRSDPPPKSRGAADHPAVSGATIAGLLGQMIVARFDGTQPSEALLARIRSGQIGGVILFADNTAGGAPATRALTAELQQAAQQGGNPPLLIMTDQEGGAVKRLAGPPYRAPGAMASTSTALAQGIATGRLLRAAGINVDLAPVADVERVPGSFLGSRSFGSDPSVAANLACAFAHGLQSQGVAYALKHFPGLGRAASSTDSGPVSVDASASEIRSDYLPYIACAAGPLAMVMISNASYPNLTGPLPAVTAPLTYRDELRIVSPQTPVLTISDDLQAPALNGQPAPARSAINAGLDVLLYAQTEDASAAAYQQLLADVRDGMISPGRIRAAARAITGLKRNLTGA